MDFEYGVISADEHDRVKALHEPLAEALRRLIDASLHSGGPTPRPLRRRGRPSTR